VQIPYRAASGPLHLLVNSAGIKFSGAGEWGGRKHGANRRRQWRKTHIGINADTLEVRAVEMTSNHIGDAPVLHDLLAQIPVQELVIATRGADAIIPPSDGMPGTGRIWIWTCRRATKRYMPADGSAGPTGRNGPDITDEAAWKPS